MNTEVERQLIGNSPLIAGVIVEFVSPHVSGSGNEEIPNCRTRQAEQHAGDRVSCAACARRIIGEAGGESEPAERALTRRAGRLTDEPLPDIDAEFEAVFALFPTHVRDVFEHMFTADERLRARITQSDISGGTDNRSGWLERVAGIPAGYLRPYRVGKLLR